MRRLFWVAFGVTAGVLVYRRINQAADALTPTGVGQALAGVGDGLRELAAAVREGMDEREAELRAALGVDAVALEDAEAQSLMDDPTGPRHR